jgi:hypothetical protein
MSWVARVTALIDVIVGDSAGWYAMVIFSFQVECRIVCPVVRLRHA